MGSLCTSGPTQTYTQASTTPTGLPQLQSIWNQVQGVASTPYTPYGGQIAAGLDPTQQAGINTINAAQGTAQPYYNQATQYANSAAAPITSQSINNYLSPYNQDVINATQKQFNTSNAEQQQQVVGNAALQGALGGDRVGVAQGELARQQNLAQAPVIAGLNNANYSQALNAAQQDRAAQGQAAYSLGSLGSAVQNTALTGGGAQLGAGAVGQGTTQNQLSANYQQYLQKLAFPYQQASFLSSYGLPAVTAMGGNSNQQQTAYPSQPSLFQQIAGGAGIGLAAYDAFGGGGGSSQGSNGLSTDVANNGSGIYTGNAAYPGFAWRGGRINGYADGGAVEDLIWPDDTESFIPKSNPLALSTAVQYPKIQQSSQSQSSQGQGNPLGTIASTAMKFLPLMLNRGGRIGYADGGDVPDTFDVRFPMAGDISVGADVMANPLAARNALLAFGQQSPFAAPISQGSDVPLPQPRPSSLPPSSPYSLPPQIVNPDGMEPNAGRPTSAALGYGDAPEVGGYPPESQRGRPLSPMDRSAPIDTPRGALGLTDDARMALLSASLGTLASKSSNALGAIGEGGLQGVKTYAEQKKQREDKALQTRRVDMEAQRLMQQADQFSQTLGVHKDQLAETQKQNAFTREKYEVPPGFRRGENGRLEIIPGGPHDPETIRSEAAAKRLPGMSDETLAPMIQSYRAGNTGVLTGIGKGTQGAENLNRFWTVMAEQMKSEGATGKDLAAAKANFTGQTAALRTAANRESNIETSVNEAKGTFPLAIQRSSELPRGSFVPINKLLQMFREQTSSPEQGRLAVALQGAMTAYSQAMSRTGVNSVFAQQHAEQLLSGATSHEALVARLGQMDQEMDVALHAPEQTRKHILEKILGAPGGASSPSIPPGAINDLKANPSLAPMFDKTFGEGAAKRVLGQ